MVVKIRGFAIAGFVVAASALAAACSSASSSDSSDNSDGSGFDASNIPICDNILAIGPDVFPSGSCDATKTPSCVVLGQDTCLGQSSEWLCVCESGAFTCTIIAGTAGTGGSCNDQSDGGLLPITDAAGSRADASDGDAS
jgi:hypothetical protein